MHYKMDTILHFRRLLTAIFFLGVTCGVLAERRTNESVLEAGIYSQVDSVKSVQQASYEDEVLYASSYLPEIVTPQQSENTDSQVSVETWLSVETYFPVSAAEAKYTNSSQSVKMYKKINSEGSEINTTFSVSVADYQDGEHTQMFTSAVTGQIEQEDMKETNIQSHEDMGAHYDSTTTLLELHATAATLSEELMDHTFTYTASIDKETDTQTSTPDSAEQFITTGFPLEVHQTADLNIDKNHPSTTKIPSEEYMDYPFPNTPSEETATQNAEKLITTVTPEIHQTANLQTTANQLSIATAPSQEYIDYVSSMSKEIATQDAEQLIRSVTPEENWSVDLDTDEKQSSIDTALSEEYMDYPFPLTTSMSTEIGTQSSLGGGTEHLIATASSLEAHQSADLGTTVSEEYMDYSLPLTTGMSKETTTQTKITDEAEQLITMGSSPKEHQKADLDTAKNQSSNVTTPEEQYMDYPFPLTTSMSTETDIQTRMTDGFEQLITTVSSPKEQTADLDTVENQSSTDTATSEEYLDNPLPFTTSVSKETNTQISLVNGTEKLITRASSETHQTADLDTTEKQLTITTALSEEYMDYPLPLTTSMSKEIGTQTNLVSGTEHLITSALEAQQSADLDTAASEELADYPVPLTTSMSIETDTQTKMTDGADQLITMISFPKEHQTAELDTAENQSSTDTTTSEEYLDNSLPFTTIAGKETGTQASLVNGTEKLITSASSEAHQTADFETTEKQSTIATALTEEYMDYPLPLTTSMSKETGTQTNLVDGTDHLFTTSPKVQEIADLGTTKYQPSTNAAPLEDYVNYSLLLTTSMSKETGAQTSLADDTEHLRMTVSSLESYQSADPDTIQKSLIEEYTDYPLPLTTSMSKETSTQTNLFDGTEQLITTVSSLETDQSADLDTSKNQSSTVTALSEEYMDYPLSHANITSMSKENGSEEAGKLITTVTPEVHQTAADFTDSLHTSTMHMNEEINIQASWVHGVNELITTVIPDAHQIENVDTAKNQNIVFDQNLELMINSTDNILIANDLLDFAGILTNNVTYTDGNRSSLETATHDLLTGAVTVKEWGRNFTDDNSGASTTVGKEARSTNEENSTEDYATPVGLLIVNDNSVNVTNAILTDINLTSSTGSTYESTSLNKLDETDCENQQNCEGNIMESTNVLHTMTISSTEIPVQYYTSKFISDETATVIQDYVLSKKVLPEETDPENVTTEVYAIPIENSSTGHQKSERNETEHPSSASEESDSDSEAISSVLSTNASVEVSATGDDREQPESYNVVTLQPHQQNLKVYNRIMGSTREPPITELDGNSYSADINPPLNVNTPVTNHNELFTSENSLDVTTSQGEDYTSSLFTLRNLDVFHTIFNQSEQAHTNIHETTESVYDKQTRNNTETSDLFFHSLLYEQTSETPELLFSAKTTFDEYIPSQASTTETDISVGFSTQTPSPSSSEVLPSLSHFSLIDLYSSTTDSSEYLAKEQEQSFSNFTEGVRNSSKFISDETATVIQDYVLSKEVLPEETDPENVTTEVYAIPVENSSTGHQKRSTSERNETEHPSSASEESDSDSEAISSVLSTNASVEVSATGDDREQPESYNVVTLQPHQQNLKVYNWIMGSTREPPITELDGNSYSADINPPLNVNTPVTNHNELFTSKNSLDVTTSQGEDYTSSLFTFRNLDVFHTIFNQSEQAHTNIHETTESVYDKQTRNNTETSDLFFHSLLYEQTSETPELLFSAKTTFDEYIPSQASTTETDISLGFSTQTPSPSSSEILPSLSHFSLIDLYSSTTDSSEYLAKEQEQSFSNFSEGVRNSRTLSDTESHIADYDMRSLLNNQTSTEQQPLSGEPLIKETEISTQSSLSSNSEVIFSFDYLKTSELSTEGYSTVEYLTQGSEQDFIHFTESTLRDRYPHTDSEVPPSYIQSSHALYTPDQYFSSLQDEVTMKESELTLFDLETSVASVYQATALIQNDTTVSVHSAEEDAPSVSSIDHPVTTVYQAIITPIQNDTTVYAPSVEEDTSVSSIDHLVTAVYQAIITPIQNDTTMSVHSAEEDTHSVPSIEHLVTTVYKTITSPIRNDTTVSVHSAEEDTPSVPSIDYLATTEYHQSSEKQEFSSQQKHVISSFSTTLEEAQSSTAAHLTVSEDFFSHSSAGSVDATATIHMLYTESSMTVTPITLEESSVIAEDNSTLGVLLDSATEHISLTTVSEVASLLTESIPFSQNYSTVTTLQGSEDSITESIIYTTSKDTAKIPHISHIATEFLISSDVLEVTDSAVSPEVTSLESQSTTISTTEYTTCKYAEKFLTIQSEIIQIRKDYESLAGDEVNNTITVVFKITQGTEEIDLYTKRFSIWMTQMLLEGIKEQKMKSSSSNMPNSFGEASNSSGVELIYILPTPNIVDEDLIFTFIALATPNNDTIPLSEVIVAVLSDAEGMQNCMNLNLSYFIRGQYPPKDASHQVWQKYGILLVTISVLTLLIVVILITAVVYVRCKSHRSIAYISDKDRLHCDLHASTEIGDLNRVSLILEDEVFEKDTSLVNGNHVLTIGDDEGWLVPINDVPVEDKDAPDVQDTKL